MNKAELKKHRIKGGKNSVLGEMSATPRPHRPLYYSKFFYSLSEYLLLFIWFFFLYCFKNFLIEGN